MTIRIVNQLHAKPGEGAAFGRFIQERLAEVRAEPGCQQYDVYQRIDAPDSFVLLEQWADEAALEAHRAVNRGRPRLGVPHRADPTSIEQYVIGSADARHFSFALDAERPEAR